MQQSQIIGPFSNLPFLTDLLDHGVAMGADTVVAAGAMTAMVVVEKCREVVEVSVVVVVTAEVAVPLTKKIFHKKCCPLSLCLKKNSPSFPLILYNDGIKTTTVKSQDKKMTKKKNTEILALPLQSCKTNFFLQVMKLQENTKEKSKNPRINLLFGSSRFPNQKSKRLHYCKKNERKYRTKKARKNPMKYTHK